VEATVENVPSTPNAAGAMRELARMLVARAMVTNGDATEPRLVAEAGPDQGAELSLCEPTRRYVLGRSAQCDVVLEESNASRRHVEIYVRNGQIVVRDLGSKNGTKLGGQPLVSDRETPWLPEAVLEVGEDQFTLTDPVADTLAELERAADEVMPEAEDVAHPAARTTKAPTDAQPAKAHAAAAIPQRRRAKPASTDAKAVTKADLIVGLIAVGVLATSAFGLFWLLGGR
jgi:hypothetical protein